MDDTTWVLLRTRDDHGTSVTHLPTDQRVVASGSRDDVLNVVQEYATARWRHKETGEVRVLSDCAVNRAVNNGGPLLAWLSDAKPESQAGWVIIKRACDLVLPKPDPPTEVAYRVRVLVPGAFTDGKDRWLPMSRIFATEGEAAQWAKDLAATYRIEQEDTE